MSEGIFLNKKTYSFERHNYSGTGREKFHLLVYPEKASQQSELGHTKARSLELQMSLLWRSEDQVLGHPVLFAQTH